MNNSRFISVLLVIFIFCDLAFSFIQYYNTPLFGDIDVSVWPGEPVQKLFEDPFGFEVIKTGEKQFNPNRYFSHFLLYKYFRNVPLILQRFASPVSSVYLASAFAKIVIQIILIFSLASFISREKISSINFLFATIIVVPMFQAYGFWSRMGIIDKSIAYTFFYALPIALLALFFIPVFNQIKNNRKIQLAWYIFLMPLIIILPFTGPLNPPVIILVTFFIYAGYWIRSKEKNIILVLRNIPGSIHILLIPISLLSLYSLLLGMYDSSFAGEAIPLIQRYKQLPSGIWSQFFHSPGFPLMILIIGINVIIINRNNYTDKEILIRTLIWIVIFSLVYILLLPVGGYRPYRPKIIRYDTFIPVNIALLYYFGASTYSILHQIKGKKRKLYLGVIIIYLLFLTVADFKGIGKNMCERAAFEKMANSSEKIVSIPNGCFVLDWADEFDYKKTENKAELIHYWGITPEKKLFYNESR